ncbi:proteasome accessory factor PafA2 family protein [Gammaproteobacteria bacterium]|nr:proteasome accessory factor PafA2 family protein [Gammaproteobacteria bacterium]
MNKTLMGLETEYAVTPYDKSGMPLNRMHYSKCLVTAASEFYPSLFGRDQRDLFLLNGSRFYVDSGADLLNLEYSTPECTNPEELIAHIRAGDRMLAGLARRLESSEPELHQAFISKTNFDYCGHTSGSHENYLHIAPQTRLAPQLIPHLVSRIIYSGGGGFNADASHVEFMLSPRVYFLEHLMSCESQHSRAIFTTKQEPLSNSPYGRLHLLCGEGVRFELTEFLRFGVTALILRLVDAGLSPGRGIELDPLVAINTVARDIHCRELIGRINGIPVSAIDVQRHYLRQVQAQLGGSFLPDFAATVCDRWQSVLDGLESDAMQFAGILDWPTKYGLYRSFVEQKGHDWEQLTREDKESQQEIRASLFEFDMRFGDIADNGLFATFENDNRSATRLVAEDAIADAMRIPPQGSRARLRGEWIERLSQKRQGKECAWDSIQDRKAHKSLSFDDPLDLSAVAWVKDSSGHRASNRMALFEDD